MAEQEKVVVIEIVETPRKHKRLGNSLEVPLKEAVEGVKAGRYKHPDHAIGVVPSDWKTGEKVGVVAVEAEAVADDGS